MSLRTDLINILSHGNGLTRETIYFILKKYSKTSIRGRLSELEKAKIIESDRTLYKEANIFKLTPKEIVNYEYLS